VEPVLDSSTVLDPEYPMAIEVIETTSSNVTFAAHQVFSPFTLCEVAVWYDSSEFGSLVCHHEPSVPPGEISVLTADCGSDGYADISIFVKDSRFATPSVPSTEDQCQFVAEDLDELERFNYRIPCTDVCDPAVSLECSHNTAFYTSDEVISLSGANAEFGQTTEVPLGSTSVDLKFSLETGSCGLPAESSVYARVGHKYFDLGDLSLIPDEDLVVQEYGSGSSTVMIYVKKTRSTLFDFEIEIPSSFFFSYHRLEWGLKTIAVGGCVSVSDTVLSSKCTESCDSPSVLAEGIFGGDDDRFAGWTGDRVISSLGTTTILGMFGNGNDASGSVHKLIDSDGNYDYIEAEIGLIVPEDVEQLVEIEFTVTSLDETAALNLKLSEQEVNIGDEVDDVLAYVEYIGENSNSDHEYSLTALIPKKFSEGLEIGVSWEQLSGKFGITGFKFSTACVSDLQARKLDSAPVGEPDEEGEDEGPYCAPEDYPCEGGVYVCHYSAKLGYRTYCVAPEDSNVLRFYSKDFCGKCPNALSA